MFLEQRWMGWVVAPPGAETSKGLKCWCEVVVPISKSWHYIVCIFLIVSYIVLYWEWYRVQISYPKWVNPSTDHTTTILWLVLHRGFIILWLYNIFRFSMTIVYRSFTWEFCIGQASFRQPTYKSNWQTNAMFDSVLWSLDDNRLYHRIKGCLPPLSSSSQP
jgi:hypothetical protein